MLVYLECAMSDTNFHSIDETLRERFESDWMDGKPKPIEQYLPDQQSEQYEPTLAELVQIEMEFSWKRASVGLDPEQPSAREPLRVEHYIARFPRLPNGRFCCGWSSKSTC